MPSLIIFLAQSHRVIRQWLGKLEASIVGTGGFAVGTKLSLADITIYYFLTAFFDNKVILMIFFSLFALLLLHNQLLPPSVVILRCWSICSFFTSPCFLLLARHTRSYSEFYLIPHSEFDRRAPKRPMRRCRSFQPS
jgi:hypothetical protein